MQWTNAANWLPALVPTGVATFDGRISAAWQHAFNDVTPAATLAFQGAGAPFVIAGVPIARDSLLGEAGLDLAVGAMRRSACRTPGSSRATSTTTPPRGNSAGGSRPLAGGTADGTGRMSRG